MSLMDTHREKHRQIKLQCLQKVWIWTFGWLVHQVNSLWEFLNWNKIFKKIKLLLAKLRSLWKVHFVLAIPFALTLASDIVVLYRNDVFSILVLSTKKRYSSFVKKKFVFQKICFKVKVIENVPNFHWLLHKNTPISQMEGYFENP